VLEREPVLDNALCTLIGYQPAADAETWRFTV